MADETRRDMGEVSEQLKYLSKHFQEETQRTAIQIGNLEIRKAQLLGALDAMGTDLQNLINAEAARLSIPKGVRWQIDENGHAIVVDPLPSESAKGE